MKRLAGIITIGLIAIALAVPVNAQRAGGGMAGGMRQGGAMREGGAMRQGGAMREGGAMRQGGAMREGGFANRQAVRGTGGVNLTTEQREAMQAARQAFRDDTEALRNAIRAKGTELRDIIKTDDTDESEVKAVRQELHELQAELSQKSLEFRQELREEINPE